MNCSVSAALKVYSVLLRSVADLRPAGSPACWVLPSQPEVASPELASITFFKSGAKELYLAMFMHITKVVVYSAGRSAGNSLWYLTSSCTLIEGTTSQGREQASIVPLESASVMAGKGMPTGVAPSEPSSLVTWRVGPRTFMPFKSAADLICLSREWKKPGPCTLTASRCVSLNSSAACVCRYSQ